MKLTFLLTSSFALAQPPLPGSEIPVATVWRQTVEQVTKFAPPDSFEEKFVFEEVLRFTPSKSGGYSIERRRTPVASWIDGQSIPVGEKPDPIVFKEACAPGKWPEVAEAPEDRYTYRLWRACLYVPLGQIELPEDRERRIPAARYEARLVRDEVQTTFRERPGLTAKGVWKFDKDGRLLSAKIRCENAFAPGGDGSPATFTVTIASIWRPGDKTR